MKKILIYIFLLSFFSQIFGQPTTKELSVNLNLSFFDNKSNDTIKFSSIDKSNFISTNTENEFKISFFFQKYLYNGKEFIKSNKSNFNDLKIKSNKIINFWYHTSIEEVENKLIPTKDIIVVFKKNRIKMIVYLKLYETKEKIDLGKVIHLPIVFQEGQFEISDIQNPKLITIK